LEEKGDERDVQKNGAQRGRKAVAKRTADRSGGAPAAVGESLGHDEMPAAPDLRFGFGK
jgi:hypothetical protein